MLLLAPSYPLSVKMADCIVFFQNPKTNVAKALVHSFSFKGPRPSHSALYVLNKAHIDLAKTWPGSKGFLVVFKVEFPNQRPNFSGNT